jgi:hypothetical protein
LLSKNNVADPSGRPLPGRLFFLCGGFEINFEDFLRKWWVVLEGWWRKREPLAAKGDKRSIMAEDPPQCEIRNDGNYHREYPLREEIPHMEELNQNIEQRSIEYPVTHRHQSELGKLFSDVFFTPIAKCPELLEREADDIVTDERGDGRRDVPHMGKFCQSVEERIVCSHTKHPN